MSNNGAHVDADGDVFLSPTEMESFRKGQNNSISVSASPRSKSDSSILLKTYICALLLMLVLLATYAITFMKKNSFYTNHDNDSLRNTPHHSRSACNCYSDINSEHCCERTIWRTHKFGTILLGDLFHAYRQDASPLRIRTKPTPKQTNYTLPLKSDYRHVLVTRNWQDAIVSGYLYHQAGYECWMDYRGSDKPIHHSRVFDMEAHYHNKDWDSQLTFSDQYTMPPRNNRSLCQYLQDESQEDGIMITMDIALSRWYKGVVPYYTKVQDRLKVDSRQRTLFLCYEDLVDPFQQEDLFYKIATHLFPGRNTSDFRMPPKLKASLEEQKLNHSVYSGGHASTHNPKLRMRLKRLVDKYDGEIFNHTVASSSAIFNCGDVK